MALQKSFKKNKLRELKSEVVHDDTNTVAWNVEATNVKYWGSQSRAQNPHIPTNQNTMQLLKTPLLFISSFTPLSALNHVRSRSHIPNSQLHPLHVRRCKHYLSHTHHSLTDSVTNRVLCCCSDFRRDSSTSNSFTLKLRGYILFAATLSCEPSRPTLSPPKAYFLLSLSSCNYNHLILCLRFCFFSHFTQI